LDKKLRSVQRKKALDDSVGLLRNNDPDPRDVDKPTARVLSLYFPVLVFRGPSVLQKRRKLSKMPLIGYEIIILTPETWMNPPSTI
jgi:hypothetical protein